MKLLKYPVGTEKAIRIMEAENKLVFVVDNKATKTQIKKEFEDTFKAKVKKVNSLIDHAGKKRAIIVLSPETPALDIATQLGLL